MTTQFVLTARLDTRAATRAAESANLISDPRVLSAGLHLAPAERTTGVDPQVRWIVVGDLFLVLDGSPTTLADDPVTIQEFARRLQETALRGPELAKLGASLGGGFAFFAYDLRSGSGVVMRDRYGLVPIFVAASENSWRVSNSPLAAAHTQDRVAINRDYLSRYLIFRYDEVFGHQATFFRDVSSIPSASYAFLGKTVAPVRYWTDFDVPRLPDDGYGAAVDELARELRRSVSRCVEGISEPECILGLSGGMDSTAVAAMCQALGKPLASFTASYGTDAPVDEIHRAEEVARALCRSWTPISISATEFVDAWKGSYAIHQQPMATSSSLGYDLLCHRIQELGYRHFMTGGSSDDLFAGNYPAYLYNLADLAERDPAAFSQELADWVDHHSTEEFPKNIGVFHAFYSQNVAVGSGGSIHPRPRLIQSEYVHSHALPSALSSAPPVTVSGPTYLDAYLKYGIWYAAKPPGQMPFIEAARHYRIDVLDPFLSEQLIRFAFTLPPRFKVRRGWNKAILREAMRGILPDLVTRQATKTGFDVPFSHWLREATLKDFVNDVLESGKNGPVGDYIDVGRLRKDIGAGAVVSPMLVWQTTNAILWLQQYKTIVNF